MLHFVVTNLIKAISDSFVAGGKCLLRKIAVHGFNLEGLPLNGVLEIVGITADKFCERGFLREMLQQFFLSCLLKQFSQLSIAALTCAFCEQIYFAYANASPCIAVERLSLVVLFTEVTASLSEIKPLRVDAI